MQELSAHIMVTVVIIVIGMVALEFMNFLLKRRTIKMGKLDEQHVKLLINRPGKYAALKWGILLLFGGFGLVLIGLLPYDAETSPIPWGIEVIFLGLGFLVYYGIIRKMDRD